MNMSGGNPSAPITSSWLIAACAARRTSTLLKGGCRWLRVTIDMICSTPRCAGIVIAGIAPQCIDEIERHDLEIIQLAGLQRSDPGRLVGHAEQFHPVELHEFAAGQAIRRLGTRTIIRIAIENRTLARPPFVTAKQERSGTDDFRHLLRCIKRGNPSGHHGGNGVAGFAEGVDDEGERLVQVQLEGFFGHHAQILRRTHQLHAERFASGPAADRGDAILRCHGCAVAPDKSVAQAECVDQAVVADLPALQHLRMVATCIVDPDQHVEHHVGEHAGGVDRGDDRVKQLQLGVQRNPQHLRLRPGSARARRSDRDRQEKPDNGTAEDCTRTETDWHREVLFGNIDLRLLASLMPVCKRRSSDLAFPGPHSFFSILA